MLSLSLYSSRVMLLLSFFDRGSVTVLSECVWVFKHDAISRLLSLCSFVICQSRTMWFFKSLVVSTARFLQYCVLLSTFSTIKYHINLEFFPPISSWRPAGMLPCSSCPACCPGAFCRALRLPHASSCFWYSCVGCGARVVECRCDANSICACLKSRDAVFANDIYGRCG